MACECLVSWPTVSEGQSEPAVSFAFPECPPSNVEVDVIRRSSVLSQALLEEAPCGVDNVALCLPSTRFHDWLECVRSIRKGRLRDWAATKASGSLISFLNACDYFADEEATQACCEALGARLFVPHADDDTTHPSDTEPCTVQSAACKVLDQLTEDFAILVLRAGTFSLDFHLQHLDACWHRHAVHAACPEIVSQSLLQLDCSKHSYTAVATALGVFSQRAGDHSLRLLNATLLSDFSHCTSPSGLQFSFKLDNLLRCGLHDLHIDFAAITDQNAVVFMYALARSSTLHSLRLGFQELPARLHSMLAGVVSQLSCLKALRITVQQALCGLDDNEQSTQPPSILQLCNLTGLSSLTLEGFCCGPQCPAHSLAKCLTGMLHLQQLDITPLFTKPSDGRLLASSISGLARLSSLVLKGEYGPTNHDLLWSGPTESLPPYLLSLTHLRQLHLQMDSIPGEDDELKPLVKAVQGLVCLESLSFPVREAKEQSLAVLAALCAGGRVLECTSLQLRATEYNTKDVDAALCKRLCCLTGLQRLSLHMCIIQDNERESSEGPCRGVPLLAALSRLTFLCMDSVIDRDGEEMPEGGADLEIDGPGFLTALGSASKLQHLQVSMCTLLAEDLDSLAAAFPALVGLQELSLQYCWTPNGDTPEQVAAALSCLTSLTRLNLTQSALGENSCSSFVEAAAHLTSLRDLSMAHIELESPSAAFTAQALPRFASLTRLDLSHCNFCAATAKILFRGVQEMRQLAYLDLSFVGLEYHNGIGASVWPIVAKSLSQLLSLRTVLLRGCDMPTRDSDRVAAALSSLSGLQRVDLRDNALGVGAVNALQGMRARSVDAADSGCFVLT